MLMAAETLAAPPPLRQRAGWVTPGVAATPFTSVIAGGPGAMLSCALGVLQAARRSEVGSGITIEARPRAPHVNCSQDTTWQGIS